MTEQDYLALRDEIQRLRDEQQRLRDEQERVRRNHDANGSGKSPHEGDKSAGGNGNSNEENRNSAQKQNTESEEKANHGGNQDKDDEGQAPKPPLAQRARGYFAAHRRGVILGAVGTVLLIVAAIVLIMYLDSYESTDDAEVDGHLDPISSRIAGTVAGVYVENDQEVQAGQLLVELDSRDNQLAVDQARATHALATAQLRAENPNVPIIHTTNETTIRSGQADLVAAQAAVAASEQEYQARQANLKAAIANNGKAQADVKRYQALVQKDEVSREQYDSVVANAETQAAAVEAAQASSEAAEKVIEQSRAQLLQTQSRLQQANENAPRADEIGKQNVATRQANAQAAAAELRQAELNLSYLKIFAPVTGIVGQRTAEIGQRVQAGQQIMTLSETSDIWITANFKETQLKRMRLGQAVDIHVDAYGTTYHGYLENMPGASGAITSLLPPENATGNFVKVVQRLPVRILLNQGQDPQHLLKLGMSVEPKVWLNRFTAGPR